MISPSLLHEGGQQRSGGRTSHFLFLVLPVPAFSVTPGLPPPAPPPTSCPPPPPLYGNPPGHSIRILCLRLDQPRTNGRAQRFNNPFVLLMFCRNVSKHNYCFSDFPFPDDVPDFPHHTHMAEYINSYAEHFGVRKHISFNTKVTRIEKVPEGWKITSMKVDDRGMEQQGYEETFVKFVAIATGHHAKPSMPHFDGQETFPGRIFHSVEYKDAITNGLVGKKVVVVGIGNSAVDVAVNVTELGGKKPISISTRSGAWVVPNYVQGYPADHYACRLFFWLPWSLSNFVFELIIQSVLGSPWRWNLNPKMRARQTQPTVSPTLIHHIQRGNVEVKPNIAALKGSEAVFADGTSTTADAIVCCTGYHIHLPFLDSSVRELVVEENTNKIKLFKNVFAPEIGASLALIGFAQPASGGLLSISEIQARWFSELCKGTVKLPSVEKMLQEIKEDQQKNESIYFASARHTIQQDPITYNDEIASYFGAKPQLWKHPSLVWNLIVGSCGAAQWRLQGPHKWGRAKGVVRTVPITPLMHYGTLFVLVLLFFIVVFIIVKCV